MKVDAPSGTAGIQSEGRGQQVPRPPSMPHRGAGRCHQVPHLPHSQVRRLPQKMDVQVDVTKHNACHTE